jgi:Cys-rich protein (TIGR01571 family)
MACWCPSLALGQVMTRLGLDWTATPVRNSHQRTWSPFKVMALFTAVYYVIYVFVNAIVNPYIMISPDGNPPNPPTWVSALMVVRSLIGFAFGIFVLVMMIRTRAYIRQKSAIREQYCSGCDDCCLSFWCGCCTVAQMDRHTTDFRQCQAACCSETGLSQQTPFIV